MFTELCAGKHQLRAFTENSIIKEFLTYAFRLLDPAQKRQICPDGVRLKATKQSLMLCALEVY